MTQELIVALIVVLAVAYAAWHWMPQGLRRRLAGGIAGGSRRLGASDAQAERIAQAVGAAGGCGSCDSCNACGPASPDAPAAERPLRRH
ncbi:DUF6587 family protein [Xylophilus sp.]|uniref:DUF6587 family protein n=1 Tax=Xylophilus sp. TaxID=2653893 RepID=UPI0013BA294A|nr:DUF6587 family protein [Xylophilus sp.]KAF1043819.1 MAG: hypothetical protein GAK38_03795 [Xylophilus sp.]